MTSLPLISSDPGLYERVLPMVRQTFGEDTILVQLETREQAVDYLRTDMPELILLSFADEKVDAFDLLEAVDEDPWLVHGGIVALEAGYEADERLSADQEANVLVSVPGRDLDRQLPRILQIIQNNQRLLFQREIGADLVRAISGSFKLRNDNEPANFDEESPTSDSIGSEDSTVGDSQRNQTPDTGGDTP